MSTFEGKWEQVSKTNEPEILKALGEYIIRAHKRGKNVECGVPIFGNAECGL